MTFKRLRVASSGIFILLFLLCGRLFYIQIFQALNYSEKAEKQSVKKVKTESFRGEIYDRNGELLASSIESQSIFVRPREVTNPKELIHFLQASLGINSSGLREKISSGSDFVWLERKSNPRQARLAAERNLDGLGVQSEQKRYYPNGPLACHLIGFVGMDNHGLSGIEQSLDSFLTGKMVVRDQLRDGKGRKILSELTDESANSPASDQPSGPSVVLTIDRSLQHIAEREIREGVEQNRAKRGMIIVQNPKTGEILAMASYPSFDPNELVRGNFPAGPERSELQNPMVGMTFEPGSTFKIVTFAAALEEKKFSVRDTVFCEGGKWKYQTVTIKDHEPEKDLSFSEVLEKSSNIGSAKIGLKLGKDTFYQYVRAFGFGTKTGIPLPGEAEGILKKPKEWSQVSLPNLSFGQGIGVNAVQVIGAFSAVANGGLLMEPLIYKQLNESRRGKIKKTAFSPQVVRTVISKETADILKGILRSAVETGTGMQAKIEGYSVGGKTGTAQKIDPRTKKYSSSEYIASFCGFVPAEDPQLVCLVILDSPKKDYWGGSTAAPVFARVVSRAVRILGIPPQDSKPLLLAQKR